MIKKIGAIVFILFFIFIFYGYYKGRAQRKSYHFSGIIEKITYDVKMIPYLTVHGKSYYLSPLRDFGKKVKVGDSVIKLSGDLKILKRDHIVIEYEL